MTDNTWRWWSRWYRRQRCGHYFQPRFDYFGRHYVCAFCGERRKRLDRVRWGA